MHVAVIGTGRVGRPTAYTLLHEPYIEELSVVDIKPGLARTFAEELKHAAVSLRRDIEIHAYENDEDLSGADIIIVCAGYPRKPGEKISRRDLVHRNSEIIKFIAEVVSPRNRGARYVIVTNPVDAMATLFKKISKETFVISTGTHLETLRFKAKLAEVLKVPFSAISGFVGGEHGENAVMLWSTVRVNGLSLNELEKEHNIKVNRNQVEEYVKGISRKIIEAIGATEYGPASAFRDIIRGIAINTDAVLSISIPLKFNEIPEEVHVSVPVKIGKIIDYSFYDVLTLEEKKGIIEAAKAIYNTYRKACELLGIN